jgi:hypothetical protein
VEGGGWRVEGRDRSLHPFRVPFSIPRYSELPVLRAAAATSLLFFLACGGEAAEAGDRATAPLEPTTRDSSGVTIHEHPADALERAPLITMDSVPLAVIGDDTEANDVSSIHYMAFLSDGRVAGFDGRAGALRIFGVDGAAAGSFGRRGEGPGEFRGVERVVRLPGDTLLLTDWVARRVTLVHPDTGILRLEAAPTRGVRQSFVVAGVLSGGEWMFVPSAVRLLHRSAGPEPDTTRQPLPIGLYRSGSAAEQGTTETVEGPRRFSAWPFGLVWEGLPVTVPNDSWRLLVHDGTGTLRSMIRINRPRIAATAGFKDSMVADQIEQIRKLLEAQPELARYENVDDAEFNARNAPWVDSLPPFGTEVSSAGKLLWLETLRFKREMPAVLLAFHPDGRLMGRLTVPGEGRILAIADDRIAVRTENDDGIARIQVYRLSVPQ